jgi:uncharacterized protein YndB with AHSA1/START domain
VANDVLIQLSLPADRARVWRALTVPDALCAWFWPQAAFGTVADVDLRVGGSFRIHAPSAQIGVSGTYQALDPPRCMIMTWQWDGEDHVSLVMIDLATVGDRTELTLRHERLSGDTAPDEHGQGWSDCFDRLPAWLTRCTRTLAP